MPSGVTLQLSNGSSDAVTISANGSFAFPTALSSGATYSVTVAVQPVGETCVVTSGGGVVAASNVTTIAVNCEQTEFALVPNRADGTTSVYRIDPTTGALNPVPDSPFPTGSEPNDITVSGNIAYIAQLGSNTVQGFAINPSTGSLTALAGAVAVGLAPASIVSDLSGRFVYVADTGSDTVTTLSIDPTTHALTTIGTTTIGDVPTALAISPTGQSLYVADWNSNFVSSFTINTATGALTATSGSSFSFVGFQPFAITVAPSGEQIYTLCNGGNDIFFQSVDPSTGQLGVGASYVSPGSHSIAIAPSGKVAYVGNTSSSTIQTYDIIATSGFDNIFPRGTGGQISSGSAAAHVTIDPTGRWLYAPTVSGTIAAFTIDANTGALTAVPGSQVPTGNGPTTLVIARPGP
ncbi:lactonase family protein [Paraburkholderia sp. UCT2]|uniref:lactonase family protein n=1 Tax=Paraburkholderia sp. UCT2 TaxID=2615208 RepID=UPI001654C80C|nr:beta-propeller fold lactonase family protein [Paraburkholderia sp. UCT2]